MLGRTQRGICARWRYAVVEGRSADANGYQHARRLH